MVWKNNKGKPCENGDYSEAKTQSKNKKAINERETINRQFSTNPKAVYRKFKAEVNTKVVNMPTKDEIGKFWGGIWNNRKQYKSDAKWYWFQNRNIAAELNIRSTTSRRTFLKK